MQASNNLIDNDPMVAAVFAAVANIPSEPYEKMRAVARAGKIAEAYFGPNLTQETRRVMSSTFEAEVANPASPSEPQFADSVQ